jgi:chromosome segregation ATPase
LLRKENKDAKQLVTEMQVAFGKLTQELESEREAKGAVERKFADQRSGARRAEELAKTLAIEKQELEESVTNLQASSDYFQKQYRKVQKEESAHREEVLRATAAKAHLEQRVAEHKTELDRLHREVAEMKKTSGPRTASDYRGQVDELSRTIEHSRMMEEKLASSNKVNEYLNSLLILRNNGAAANGNGSAAPAAADPQAEGKIVRELQSILKTDRDLQERVSFVPTDGFAPMHLRNDM